MYFIVCSIKVPLSKVVVYAEQCIRLLNGQTVFLFIHIHFITILYYISCTYARNIIIYISLLFYVNFAYIRYSYLNKLKS